MMRGETVYVNGVAVDNVLVAPGQRNDVEGISIPAGAEVSYTLYFPIAYTDTIQDATIEVRGNTCSTIGYSDHWKPQQVFTNWLGQWDMVVLVERKQGDMTAQISIVTLTRTRDRMGDFTDTEVSVWEGLAQARMSGGVEALGSTPAGVSSREVWWFVVPWQESFADLRPQRTYIDYNGARYDVQAIKNLDEKSKFASIEAVRHG